MIIGNKISFAVEFELDENPGGAWLYGKFCYWVGGVRLGDYYSGVSLRDVLFQLTSVVKDCGKRYSDMSKFDDSEIFGRIYASIYKDVHMVDQAARFEITMQVDVFDSVMAFLVDFKDLRSRIIYSIEDGSGFGNDVKGFDLDLGEFDAVVSNCFEKLDSLYDAAISSLQSH